MAFPRVSSRTLPGFLSVFPARFPTTPSSFLGKPRGNPGETPWNSSFWGGSEPCLRLFWGQNRQNTGYFAGIPGKPRYTWKIPGYRADFLNFFPQILPQTSSQTQGNSRVSRGKLERNRMEHQTPSGFPGNFRKRKVLGTLWFPSGLPETLGKANSSLPSRPQSQSPLLPRCVPP